MSVFSVGPVRAEELLSTAVTVFVCGLYTKVNRPWDTYVIGTPHRSVDPAE
jgi:hypothetical protein